ncbi:MAG: iron ABC transporter permease [Proteobacteria bacterium]|nr:iron ABC transporter permease [Pseudomonadota bacterium]
MTAAEGIRDGSAPKKLALKVTVDGWSAAAIVAALLVAFPVMAVVALALFAAEPVFGHLAATVLPRYVTTTALLLIGVGAGTAVLGVTSAWLVTMYKFPGCRMFEWALLLPLSMPAYVIAFVYTELLDYAGPVQGALRAAFGWSGPRAYWFPEIRSLPGAIVMMTLVLYPYVYLLTRAAFLEQSAGVVEISRTLGRGPWRSFFSVSLALARPAVVAGVSLALMETLNDYGTVDFFAVQTLTLGIFDVWRNMNNLGGAAQIATLMLAFVVVLVAAERFARRGQRFHHTTRRQRRLPPAALSRWGSLVAVVACMIPLTLGFLLPAGWLARDALVYIERVADDAFLASVANSLLLSGVAACIAVVIAIVLAYGLRLRGHPVLTAATRLASVGYAVPGAILAIGVLIPLAWLDNAVDGFLRARFGVATGLILSGTMVAVTYGYAVRFLALSLGAIETSMARITPSIDGAARTLGAGPGQVLVRVHLPIIRGSILTAVILVFVDGMKELPMTVIMRPFNFETLATQVHYLSAAERFGAAAPSALAIVLVGLLPVVLLSRAIARVHEAGAEMDPVGEEMD